MTAQLRDYWIDPQRFDEFLDAWRRQVPPLRERYGFGVQAWLVPDDARLVWVLSFSGSREAFEEADAAYYASAERRSFDPNPRIFIVEAQQTWLTPLP